MNSEELLGITRNYKELQGIPRTNYELFPGVIGNCWNFLGVTRIFSIIPRNSFYFLVIPKTFQCFLGFRSDSLELLDITRNMREMCVVNHVSLLMCWPIWRGNPQHGYL